MRSVHAQGAITENPQALVTLFRIVALDVRAMLTQNGLLTTSGLCGDASEVLLTHPMVRGVRLVLVDGEVGGEGHYWVEHLPTHLAIDCTGDQWSPFRTGGRKMPKVYVGPRPRWYTVVRIFKGEQGVSHLRGA